MVVCSDCLLQIDVKEEAKDGGEGERGGKEGGGSVTRESVMEE